MAPQFSLGGAGGQPAAMSMFADPEVVAAVQDLVGRELGPAAARGHGGQAGSPGGGAPPPAGGQIGRALGASIGGAQAAETAAGRSEGRRTAGRIKQSVDKSIRMADISQRQEDFEKNEEQRLVSAGVSALGTLAAMGARAYFAGQKESKLSPGVQSQMGMMGAKELDPVEQGVPVSPAHLQQMSMMGGQGAQATPVTPPAAQAMQARQATGQGTFFSGMDDYLMSLYGGTGSGVMPPPRY